MRLISRRHIVLIFTIFAICVLLYPKNSLSMGSAQTQPKTINIAVNLFVQHPNIDAVYEGFREVVGARAEQQDIDIQYDLQNALGDVSVANQIARKQVADNPGLILSVGTPSVQASKRATSQIPIIFGAMTDPIAAGVVNSLEVPGGNCTGTSDAGPYDKQIKLIRQLLPDAQKIGIIRNPGESNSVAAMKTIDKDLMNWNFTKIEVPVSNTSEVLAAANALVKRCDVFYIPPDNTVLSALDAVISVARANKIPLFVTDEGSVEMGAVATIGIDYLQLGRVTGNIAIKVLQGTPPGSIPVAFGEATQLVVNLDAARQQGVEFPSSLLEKAKVLKK